MRSNDAADVVAKLFRFLFSEGVHGAVVIPDTESNKINITIPVSSERDWADTNELAQQIITVLRDTGHRMTAVKMREELERRGHIYCDRTVEGMLSRLRKDGKVTNEKNADPPGYAPCSN